RAVRTVERTALPSSLPPRSPRRPFQSQAGGKVYQCVFGTRLKLGTEAQPQNGAVAEPVAICVELGSTDQDAIRYLSNAAVLQIANFILGSGIAQGDGTINPQILESFADAPAVTSVTGAELDSSPGLTLLRVRSAGGFVGTGCIVTGNST